MILAFFIPLNHNDSCRLPKVLNSETTTLPAHQCCCARSVGHSLSFAMELLNLLSVGVYPPWFRFYDHDLSCWSSILLLLVVACFMGLDGILIFTPIYCRIAMKLGTSVHFGGCRNRSALSIWVSQLLRCTPHHTTGPVRGALFVGGYRCTLKSPQKVHFALGALLLRAFRLLALISYSYLFQPLLQL